MKNIERFIPLMVLAAGVAAYHNCLQNEFIFDDRPYIQDNPHIRSLWPPQEIFSHSTRPVINFSLAVNYAMGGLNPWGYHAVNVVIHLLAALLLYGVVRRSMEARQIHWKWAGSASCLAGLVATLWVVHPLQTQAVSYVWQRCESLMGLFYLLTLYCVIRGNHSTRTIWWWAGAVVSCALGMASKEVMVTAPVVVLLYDWVFLAGSWKEVRQRRWGLYAGLAGTWLILAVLMARGAAQTDVYLPTADVAYKEIPPWSYLLTQAGVIVHYLRLALWPDTLCLDYESTWPVAKSVTDALPGLIVVGGLLLLTAWTWWRKPALGFVGTWFFLILAPTSSFVPIGDVVFEQRMYLSLAAVIVLGVVAVVTLLERLPRKWQWLEWGAGAVALIVAITLAAMTRGRNEDYRSSLTIWQDTATKRPQNARALLGWGLALQDLERNEEAMDCYEEALRIKSNYPEAQLNWGNALVSLKRFEAAAPHYQEALRIRPDYAIVHCNWGSALQNLGRTEEAISHYQEALRINPSFAEAHASWGNALQDLRRTEDAVAHYHEALKINPNLDGAHFDLGNALVSMGRFDEAVTHYQEAVRINPYLAQAHSNWGTALALQGRLQEAVEQFQQALRLRPDLTTARNNLRRAEEQLRQKNGSVQP